MPEQSPTRFTMVPARRSTEPTARRRARRILGTLFLASSLSVVAVFVALGKGNATPDLSRIDPRGRDLAYTAAVNYLSGSRQNVSHAESFDPEEAADVSRPDRQRAAVAMPYRSMSWVGFTPQHFGSADTGYVDFEVHHFLVVTSPADPAPHNSAQPAAPRPSGGASASPSSSGRPPAPSTSPAASGTPSAPPAPAPGGGAPSQTPASDVLKLDVPVLLTAEGPRLAASPSFSVWTGQAGRPSGRGDYTDFNGLVTDVSEAVVNQVGQWARAYANGDSAALLAVTGDQASGHRYQGLAGFTLPDSHHAVQILSSIKVAGGQLVVRARVMLARRVADGTVSGGDSSGRQFVTYADFDLLVGAPTGAQPPILAWGPAGSAAELEPYSNAITE